MALTLTAKAPAEVFDYTWQPPFDADDGLASYTASATGVTIDSAGSEGDEVTVFLSGGTAGQTATITLTAESMEGRFYSETLYLPIRASTAAGESVERVISFAYRRIKGVGRNPNAVETEHALECLSDMLRAWRDMGADVGAPEPLLTASVLYIADGDLSAVKNNLIVALSDLYGETVSPSVAMLAKQGLQRIKQRGLPAEREGAEFF